MQYCKCADISQGLGTEEDNIRRTVRLDIIKEYLIKLLLL